MIFDKKTKVIVTLSAAAADPKVLEGMIMAGANAIRLNFSHSDHKTHEEVLSAAREIYKKLGQPLVVIQDLSGPKIRIGDFMTESVILKKGQQFTLTTEDIVGNEERVSISYKKLPEEIRKGDRVLIDDGKLELSVRSVKGTEIVCTVLVGGMIRGRRGVNLPGVPVSLSSLTQKDRKDIPFGVKHGVDYFALSFVRRPEDVMELRGILKKKRSQARIIAKIETQEALENLDGIIEVVDAVMVARGDLAVEVPPEEVPVYQKRIVSMCTALGKPVIIATQMLESMVGSPVATRAEVSDVANSIFDGTDAVMLSGETSVGMYPIEAVQIMSRTARYAEKYYPHEHFRKQPSRMLHDIVDSVSSSVVHTAEKLDAKVIVALSESGFTARMIARYRPSQPVLVFSPKEATLREITLSFGCYPVRIDPFKSFKDVEGEVRKQVLANKLAKKGEKVVVAGGMPFGRVGGTNMMYVMVV